MSELLSRRGLLFASASLALAQTGPADLNRVKVGEPALPFELPSAAGGKKSLDSLRGKNAVLVFYRGYW